jgi:hypothetical protein
MEHGASTVPPSHNIDWATGLLSKNKYNFLF